jgi:hypothetical protein
MTPCSPSSPPQAVSTLIIQSSLISTKLEQASFPHVLHHFDGPHDWAPPDVMDEAFAWFRLIAMKRNREARDENFTALQRTNAVARAQALEQSDEAYEAWREYRQAITSFDGIADTGSLRQAAAALAQQKAVRDGASGKHRNSKSRTS